MQMTEAEILSTRSVYSLDDRVLPNTSSDTDRSEDKYAIDEKHTHTHKKLVFTSPRFSSRDEDIFRKDPSLYSLEKRWDSISEQAGKHKQDGRVLIINRSLSPESLQKGLTQQAALRVQSLSLYMDQKEDNLTEWIDVISVLLVKLENLTILDVQDDEMAISKRMQRLYILTEMPKLKSIDDVPITSIEWNIIHRNDRLGQGGVDGGKRETMSVDSYEESIDGEGQLPQLAATESAGSDEGMHVSTDNSAESLDLRRSVVRQSKMEASSATSSHHEWTAACGVLAFRSLPFCGTDTKAVCDEDDFSRRTQAKKALKAKKEILRACPPVHRQSSVNSRATALEQEMKFTGTRSPAKFFPEGNVMIEVTTKSSQKLQRDHAKIKSFEAISKPHPLVRMNRYQTLEQHNVSYCSAGSPNNLMDPVQLRKTRTSLRNTSKENARTNSVFDEIYEDDEDGDALML